MSPELKEALQAIKVWADSGRPRSEIFHKSMGICSNVVNYTLDSKMDASIDVMYLTARNVRGELEELLLVQFGEYSAPFNSKENPYCEEWDKFINPARLAWLAENCK